MEPKLELELAGHNKLNYSYVARLIKKIDEEKMCNQLTNETIYELQGLVSNRENSDIKGLKNKLEEVGRHGEVEFAEEDLVLFEKVLEKLTYYGSAQQLFFYFLSKILDVFRNQIMPTTINLSRTDMEEIIEIKIIDPIVSEMNFSGGSEHFMVTPNHVRGMIFWLAERCHVRWH